MGLVHGAKVGGYSFIRLPHFKAYPSFLLPILTV